MASTESVRSSSNKGRFIVVAALFGVLAAGGVHTTATSLGSSAAKVPVSKTATPIRGVVVKKPAAPATTLPAPCVRNGKDGGARRNCPAPK
jgi:hypothetical protein